MNRRKTIHNDTDKPLKPKETMLRLWSYLKKDKIRILFVTFMVLCSTLAVVIAPLLVAKGIDNYIAKKSLDGLLIIVIILAILYIIRSVFTRISNFTMVKVTEKTLYNLRKDLFNHLQQLSLSFFDRNKKGDLMSRFTNDISIIDEALSETIVSLINSVITLIGVTTIIFIINPILAFTTILTIPLFFVLVFKIGNKSGELFAKQQKQLGELNSYTEEMISGMKVIKSYVKEDKTIEEFDKYNRDLIDTSINAQIVSNLIMPTNMAITNLSHILLFLVGAIMTVKGMATVGSILAFLNYSNMFRRPINQLGFLYASIQGALAGAERVFEVMDTEIEVKNVDKPLPFDNIKGNVVLENVNFSYIKGKRVLKNISIKVKKGENIALVGPTGAGKTTIINLLTRFYDIDSGMITIDGIDISNVHQDDLRSKIGIVLQDTYLFRGTVKENIKYGKMDATDEEVTLAAMKAEAHSFIRRLPEGYESIIDEEGSNLSQGERQLISIARAILADPEILILDEATSSVDTRTEQAINQGMKELSKGRTTFVIAHRLSTIQKADTILVINNGEIIESGSHEELLKKKAFYYNLYNNQFNI
ncbi:MAG: ABC transporter ATP-binding protein [Bacilli bacterium]|nr:ABC transporter ATP-binding protein [Bacilli bacterium]MDD4808958.1 ABC transporter ATP-binding protein [Bacilli bacterium]